MTNQVKAMILGFMAVFLWSTVATAFSLSLSQQSPAQLLLVASFTSLLFLITLIIYKKQWSELVFHFIESWKSSLFFGAINPFIYYLVLLEAYNLLPAQEAQAINYTWAIMLSFMAVPILKQKLVFFDLIAAACCYFGVLVIATNGSPLSLEFSNFYGVILALVSTIIWASYWLLNTKDQRPSLIGLTLNFAFALPLILIYWWLTEDNIQWSDKGVLSAIYIGFFEMGLTFVLWNNALKLTSKATKVANLIFLAPILSIFWLSQFTDEAVKISTLIGLACILIGLTVQNIAKARKEN
ncbi:DMT family transporter [Marinomonas sp. 15G1-11]|uniref:DMT family transporter n=1 Tax=Marinomonas phaeophyticola TaxID=3004091 RepID=A0ABT4JZS3_9GAMM|nr:DMT family transporter [Marinomonas sp. 15G1-11]MCZ2723273.1 DMT family transporter [Marinomonas sp. 15G1-11]